MKTMHSKLLIRLSLSLLLFSCSSEVVERAPIPNDELLIIAHRGASAYMPEHSLLAYELAVDMDANYIELDLHMTKDHKLVVIHDSEIILKDKEQAVAQLTLEELKAFSPGNNFNELHPELASSTYQTLSVLELSEVLANFSNDTNYYIEIKAPARTPGIEKELIDQLQANYLLNRSDKVPKVIIQSYDTKSLKKVFQLDPTIPLVKLYGQKTKRISNREMSDLITYASGIGINKKLLSRKLIDQLHKNKLHVHPFVLNDETQMKNTIELGVDGFFTDKPVVSKSNLPIG